MNKYVVFYRAEIRDDLSDDLIHAGEVVDVNIFDYDEALTVCADSFLRFTSSPLISSSICTSTKQILQLQGLFW